MSLETVTLEHVPSSHVVHLAFFRDVQNASFLHQQLLARNADFEYTFVDASVIISRTHLLSAVFKAVTNVVNGALKTPNVHSEIVVSLSASNNIADAYRRYGISPSTTSLLVVKVTFPKDASAEPTTSADIWKHLQGNVKGEPVPATDENIAASTDLQAVRKNYKLNGLAWLDAIEDVTQKHTEMEKLILGGMALRGL